MSQTSEIPAFAYTLEMETLGALPDIPTFDGEPVPVSQDPLTSGTRPLQLLPLPGTEFPLRYETSRMRGFQAEVDLGKARSGGSATDASAFWDLLDPSMRARVIVAGFGDYAAGLRRTQSRFPPAMRYALMERWNDCTHTFVFGFGEMTLTPVDYATITGLRFIGPVWAYEYRIYPGGPSGDTPIESRRIPRYMAHCHHTYSSGEDPEYWRSFLNDREPSDLFLTPWDCDAWRTYPGREVDLGKARSGGSATDASAFWDLLDPSMRARVIVAGFGDYAAGLRRTQSRFPPAMRYALMERWNDCTHTFVFGFGEMTLTPVDYATITGLRFIGPVWAYEYRIYPGGPSGDTPIESRRIPRYMAHCHHTYSSGEDPEYWRSFLNDREPSDVEYRGFSANDFLSAGNFPVYFSSRMQARLPKILEYTQEWKTHKTAAHYRAEAAAEAGAAVAAARQAGIIPGDVPFPPGMEVVLDPDLGLGSGITIPADLRRAPPLPQLDREHTTDVLAQRYLEDLEIERLWRHQSRQSSAVSRLQVEVDRLRTRLEVEGIPLDSSDEDDDGCFDDAPPSPPPQAAARPSRRRR
ncbi:hypothetical protein JCGZ_03577 [Jatropha curcas]|uniref:Aminotransferase-like plant mobile domain-containing protein n=1 Tax=Jatropha curcas TaxID=180498 RepID=A0A067L962_JATCU|nr:hypothetical protein JCGZ_03577 [Jatropha curcas]